MRSYLQPSAFILFGIMLNAACNSSADEKNTEINKQDTTTIISVPAVPVKPTLKETVLNEKTLITGKKLYNSGTVGPDEFKSLSIRNIDSTGGDENGFRYHIVDTLFSGPDSKVLLIGREYESENYVWIAVFDNNNKLIDHKTVYYDNAEGFMSVESGIRNNLISITTINEYAENEKGKKVTGIFQLDGNNKIVKAP